MKKELIKTFQIAAVFIGTIVGAGLASGQEINNFFTSYGLASFIGIIICGFFYIIMSSIIIKISIRYSLNSYSDIMKIINPNIFGKFTGVITTLYLISSASIILAGSGALLNQFFGIPKIVGSLLMMCIAIVFLLKDTDGLIEINSFIVPSLLFIISIIFILYVFFAKDVFNLEVISNVTASKKGVLGSTLLYVGYNVLCCSGVLAPLSTETNNSKVMIRGVALGAIGLTILSCAINLLLLVNQGYISELEIPLLFIAQRFGSVVQASLLVIIMMEMFSTEVSDVYSISKTLEQTFKIDFKKAIFIVLACALPISLIGFKELITKLYPLFGVLSIVFFVIPCLYFYYKHRGELKNL